MDDKKIKIFKPEVWERDWGQEILLGHSKGKYTLKMLVRKAGAKGGLQYHRVKDEIGYLFSGEILFRYDNGDGKLTEVKMTPGQSVHIPAGCVHQEEAITDSIMFEASNPVFDDRVRMEEHYGLTREEGGLPTTTEPRIE